MAGEIVFLGEPVRLFLEEIGTEIGVKMDKEDPSLPVGTGNIQSVEGPDRKEGERASLSLFLNCFYLPLLDTGVPG